MALFPKLSIDDFRRHIVYGFSSYEMVYAGPILDRKYNFITCHSRTFNLFAILTVLFRKPFCCIFLLFSFLLSLIPPSPQRVLALSRYFSISFSYSVSLSYSLTYSLSLMLFLSLSFFNTIIYSFILSFFVFPIVLFDSFLSSAIVFEAFIDSFLYINFYRLSFDDSFIYIYILYTNII